MNFNANRTLLPLEQLRLQWQRLCNAVAHNRRARALCVAAAVLIPLAAWRIGGGGALAFLSGLASIVYALLEIDRLNREPGSTTLPPAPHVALRIARVFLQRQAVPAAALAVAGTCLVWLAGGGWTGLGFLLGSGLSGLCAGTIVGILLATSDRIHHAVTRGALAPVALALNAGAAIGAGIIGGFSLIAAAGLYLAGRAGGNDPGPGLLGLALGVTAGGSMFRLSFGAFQQGTQMAEWLIGPPADRLSPQHALHPGNLRQGLGVLLHQEAAPAIDLFESLVLVLVAAILTAPEGAALSRDVAAYPLTLAGLSGLIALGGFLWIRSRGPALMAAGLSALFLSAGAAALLYYPATLAGWAGPYGPAALSAIHLYLCAVLGVAAAAAVPILGEQNRLYAQRAHQNHAAARPETRWFCTLHHAIRGGLGLVASAGLALWGGFELAGSYGATITAVATLGTAALIAAPQVAGSLLAATRMEAEPAIQPEHLHSIGQFHGRAGAIGRAYAAVCSIMAAFAALIVLLDRVTALPLDDMAGRGTVLGLLAGVALALWLVGAVLAGAKRSGHALWREVQRQVEQTPGILEGRSRPNLARCVDTLSYAGRWGTATTLVVLVSTPFLIHAVLGASALLWTSAAFLAAILPAAAAVGMAEAPAGTTAHAESPLGRSASPLLHGAIKLLPLLAVLSLAA